MQFVGFLMQWLTYEKEVIQKTTYVLSIHSRLSVMVGKSEDHMMRSFYKLLIAQPYHTLYLISTIFDVLRQVVDTLA